MMIYKDMIIYTLLQWDVDTLDGIESRKNIQYKVNLPRDIYQASYSDSTTGKKKNCF